MDEPSALPTLRPITLLDGATGTELDRRGIDVSMPLWSARALLHAPDVLEQVHVDYLEAGADAITTNTFRTHRRSLARAGLDARTEELTRSAVEIACRARDRHAPDALVLGSIAPLEDCYRPELAPSAEECAAEHGEMIDHLLDAGVDMLLIETMGSQAEADVVASIAQRAAPGRWMISFCTTSDGPPGMLLSGQSLTDMLPSLGRAVAVGVNCVAATQTEKQVALLRALLPPEVRIAAYANVGHPEIDGSWRITDAIDPPHYAEHVRHWIEAGASIVGGCCGTSPATLRAVRAAIDAIERTAS